MSPQRALEGWWRGAAIAAIALLFLAAGFCCVDQDGMDHHGVPMGLCSMAIFYLVVTVSVGALVLLGLVPTLVRASFTSILLAVPEPPPRPVPFS